MSISKLTASYLTVTLGISMRSGYTIWGTALIFYLVFLGWHENWRGPLTESEITIFTARAQSINGLSAEQLAHFEMFMRDDDGGEFFMVNLVGFTEGPAGHPETGAKVDARELVQSYFRPFAVKILARAGYPAFSARTLSGYIEAWGVAANPGWDIANLIRYRSRRDLLMSATDEDFSDIHIYKRAAIAATFAVPSQSIGGALLSPRIWIALFIFVAAALAHILHLTRRKTQEKQ